MAEDSSEIVRETNEVVGSTNLKSEGELPAFFANAQRHIFMNHLQVMNQITADGLQGFRHLNQAMLTKASDQLLTTSAQESVADQVATALLNKLTGITPPVTPSVVNPTQGQGGNTEG